MWGGESAGEVVTTALVGETFLLPAARHTGARFPLQEPAPKAHLQEAPLVLALG